MRAAICKQVTIPGVISRLRPVFQIQQPVTEEALHILGKDITMPQAMYNVMIPIILPHIDLYLFTQVTVCWEEEYTNILKIDRHKNQDDITIYGSKESLRPLVEA